MRNFAKDIRFALRTLANNPGFAVIGIVTLALGMAANTTVFSVVNGFLLRPLPVPHPEQITVLALKQSSVAGTYRFSYPTYGDLRDQTGSFSRSEEHTSELQSRLHLVCRLLLEKKKGMPATAFEMARTLQSSFEFYRRSQLQPMSLPAKIRAPSHLLRHNLPATIQGIGIVSAIF